MALNQGSIAISAVYRGSTLLTAVYSGANLVWPSVLPPSTIGYVTNITNFNINKSNISNTYVTDITNFLLK